MPLFKVSEQNPLFIKHLLPSFVIINFRKAAPRCGLKPQDSYTKRFYSFHHSCSLMVTLRRKEPSMFWRPQVYRLTVLWSFMNYINVMRYRKRIATRERSFMRKVSDMRRIVLQSSSKLKITIRNSSTEQHRRPSNYHISMPRSTKKLSKTSVCWDSRSMSVFSKRIDSEVQKLKRWPFSRVERRANVYFLWLVMRLAV